MKRGPLGRAGRPAGSVTGQDSSSAAASDPDGHDGSNKTSSGSLAKKTAELPAAQEDPANNDGQAVTALTDSRNGRRQSPVRFWCRHGSSR